MELFIPITDHRTQQRFWSKTWQLATGCWQWLSAKTGGYPDFTYGGRTRKAPRLAYSMLVGPIPRNLTIDHLCLNKLCVNPAHMQVVTRAENGRRGSQHARNMGQACSKLAYAAGAAFGAAS